MDFFSHFDTIYNSDLMATDAVLVTNCGEVPQTLRMIDATSGQINSYQGVDLATTGPSAFVRASELAAKRIALADLDGGSLALSEKNWTILSHAPRPAIREVQLFLEEV